MTTENSNQSSLVINKIESLLKAFPNFSFLDSIYYTDSAFQCDFAMTEIAMRVQTDRLTTELNNAIMLSETLYSKPKYKFDSNLVNTFFHFAESSEASTKTNDEVSKSGIVSVNQHPLVSKILENCQIQINADSIRFFIVGYKDGVMCITNYINGNTYYRDDYACHKYMCYIKEEYFSLNSVHLLLRVLIDNKTIYKFFCINPITQQLLLMHEVIIPIIVEHYYRSYDDDYEFLYLPADYDCSYSSDECSLCNGYTSDEDDEDDEIKIDEKSTVWNIVKKMVFTTEMDYRDCQPVQQDISDLDYFGEAFGKEYRKIHRKKIKKEKVIYKDKTMKNRQNEKPYLKKSKKSRQSKKYDHF